MWFIADQSPLPFTWDVNWNLAGRDFIKELWWKQDYQEWAELCYSFTIEIQCANLDNSERSTEDLAMQNAGEEVSLTLLCLTSPK